MTTLTLYTAPWCEPCKRALPLVQQFSAKHGHELEVVDIDEHPKRAVAAGVMGVPTLVSTLADGTQRVHRAVPTLGI
ncbi:MAG: thioredoxin family protein [Sandaracinaceae bacterium]|nr:thioredoxin family protein [Sandaracinaceae bacterium]